MKIEDAKGVSLHRGSLRIAFRPPGHASQVKRSLGIPPTPRNVKLAANKLAAINHDIAIGTFSWERHFPNDPMIERSKLGLHRALETLYLNHDHKAWKHSTRRRAENAVAAIRRAVKDLELSKVGHNDAREARRALGDLYNYRVANAYLGVLKAVGRRAVAQGVAQTNMFASMELFKAPKGDTEAREAELTPADVYTMEEAKQLIAALHRENSRRLVTFLFWSGVRHGEAAALRRADVALPYITIRSTLTRDGVRQTPKSGQARRIFLPAPAVAAVQAQLDSHDFETVWTNARGRPVKNSAIIEVPWNNAVRRAGIRRLKPYATRHTFASWMLSAGEDEWTIAEHMGHSSLAMIRQFYGHFVQKKEHKWTLDDPAKLEMLEKLTGSIG